MAMNRVNEQAARVVRAMLDETGRTQEWLSEETGIPMRTLARRLHRTNPSGLSLDELTSMAEALGSDLVNVLIKARSIGAVPSRAVAS